ncbi:hypothetical protein [Phenylobacterium sp.]|uniref:hypothetical protein n=1 Tax=Phenylobacterium sp. TaxID=1871053 RepID=UPI002F4097D8
MMPRLAVQDIAARLTCGRCGGPDGRIYHRADLPAAATRRFDDSSAKQTGVA